MPTTVYTAIFGSNGPYDQLMEPTPLPNVEYHCYTDYRVTSDRVIVHHQSAATTPWLESRRYKTLAHQYAQGNSLWLDGRIHPTGELDHFLAEVCQQEFALFGHPYSQTLEEEAERCLDRGYLTDRTQVERQLATYRQDGYVDTFMAANGLIFRRNTAKVRQINELWWTQVQQWQTRDELSLPYVCWKLGFRPHVIERNLFDQPGFTIGSHRVVDRSLLRVEGTG